MKAPVAAMFCLAMAGCAATHVMPPLKSDQRADIDISVGGLQKHSGIIVNDLLWLKIYEGEYAADKDPVGQKKFTIEEPRATIPVDANGKYTFYLASFEGHIGGMTNCWVLIPVEPGKNSRLVIDYFTRKTSCVATLKSAGGTATAKAASFQGQIGGFQMGPVTVTRSPN